MAESADSGRVSPAIDAEREALLKTLVGHNVQFVVIGGAGIQSHGRRYDTLDIDVTPDRDVDRSGPPGRSLVSAEAVAQIGCVVGK
jgi:hypothetical protein